MLNHAMALYTMQCHGIVHYTMVYPERTAHNNLLPPMHMGQEVRDSRLRLFKRKAWQTPWGETVDIRRADPCNEGGPAVAMQQGVVPVISPPPCCMDQSSSPLA